MKQLPNSMSTKTVYQVLVDIGGYWRECIQVTPYSTYDSILTSISDLCGVHQISLTGFSNWDIISPSKPDLVSSLKSGKIGDEMISIRFNEDSLDGSHPLHLAARDSNVETVKKWLSCGTSVDITDKNDCTPLIRACATGCLTIIKELLTMGANPNWISKDHRNPLKSAVFRKDIPLIMLLLEYNIDASTVYGMDGSMTYLERHGTPEIKELIRTRGV